MGNSSEISNSALGVLCLVVLFVLALIVAAGMVGCPVYSVYRSHKAGEAEFARAEANRQILVQTAQAEQEAATHKANAEIERAKGVAEANRIIGDSLHDNEAYLRYLWVTNLGRGDTIYIPTEANMPILESGRLLTDRHRAKLTAAPQTALQAELAGEHVHDSHQHAAPVHE